jgi:hypothetical protein
MLPVDQHHHAHQFQPRRQTRATTTATDMFIENIDSECKRTEVRLRLVQSELRSITGTPIKDEGDRLRRMAKATMALIEARFGHPRGGR